MTAQFTRRTFSMVAIGGVIAAACGGETTTDSTNSSVTADPASTASNPDIAVPAGIELTERETSETAPDATGQAVTEFGLALFPDLVQSVGATENVSFSPLSVAIALAMVEPGAVGDARIQLRDLLRIDDPAAFHAGMNASSTASRAVSGHSVRVTAMKAIQARSSFGSPMLRTSDAASPSTTDTSTSSAATTGPS